MPSNVVINNSGFVPGATQDLRVISNYLKYVKNMFVIDYSPIENALGKVPKDLNYDGVTCIDKREKILF